MTIIMLNGTSSSGKTAIVRELQKCLAEPYLEAGLDKFLWMLPGRYLNRPEWDGVLGLASTAGPLGLRLVSGMHQAIAALAKAGNHVIADHVLVEPIWWRECAALFAALPAYLIGVHCPLPILEAREAARQDRTLGQAKAQFELVHAAAIYDFEVDTSLFSAAECAGQIKRFIETNTRPEAFQLLQQRRDNGN